MVNPNIPLGQENENVPFKLEAIPFDPESQASRGWDLLINGVPYDAPIGELDFVNSRMGVHLRYGRRPEGYDGPILEEPGGGGTVTLPYMLNPTDGQVYVGVVEEYRPAAGGVTDNAPRGFIDPGETHGEGAVRELAEETGLKVLAARLIPLAMGVNPSSTWFNTTGTMEDGSPKGVRLYGLPVGVNELERVETDDGQVEYVFPLSVREMAENKVEERIVGSHFIPLKNATSEKDMFTLAAAGALFGHLMGERVVRLAEVTIE